MLMIPKTLAYVWVVWMGWKLYRQADAPKIAKGLSTQKKNPA
jgi:hypothetical protein